jgi:hypothetical protein
VLVQAIFVKSKDIIRVTFTSIAANYVSLKQTDEPASHEKGTDLLANAIGCILGGEVSGPGKNKKSAAGALPEIRAQADHLGQRVLSGLRNTT